jgi:beta-glucosidase
VSLETGSAEEVSSPEGAPGEQDGPPPPVGGPEALARVRVRLTNVGGRTGREVVQVYLHLPEDTEDPERPRQWLAGAAVVTAEPGATAEARIVVPRRAVEVWDGGWRLAPGPYQVFAGASYADIRLVANLPLPAE